MNKEVEDLFIELINTSTLPDTKKQQWLARLRIEGGSADFLKVLVSEIDQSIAEQQAVLEKDLERIAAEAEAIEQEFDKDFNRAASVQVAQARLDQSRKDRELLEEIRRKLGAKESS